MRHKLSEGEKVVAKYTGYRGNEANPWFAGTVAAIDGGMVTVNSLILFPPTPHNSDGDFRSPFVTETVRKYEIRPYQGEVRGWRYL